MGGGKDNFVVKHISSGCTKGSQGPLSLGIFAWHIRALSSPCNISLRGQPHAILPTTKSEVGHCIWYLGTQILGCTLDWQDTRHATEIPSLSCQSQTSQEEAKAASQLDLTYGIQLVLLSLWTAL